MYESRGRECTTRSLMPEAEGSGALVGLWWGCSVWAESVTRKTAGPLSRATRVSGWVMVGAWVSLAVWPGGTGQRVGGGSSHLGQQTTRGLAMTLRQARGRLRTGRRSRAR